MALILPNGRMEIVPVDSVVTPGAMEAQARAKGDANYGNQMVLIFEQQLRRFITKVNAEHRDDKHLLVAAYVRYLQQQALNLIQAQEHQMWYFNETTSKMVTVMRDMMQLGHEQMEQLRRHAEGQAALSREAGQAEGQLHVLQIRVSDMETQARTMQNELAFRNNENSELRVQLQRHQSTNENTNEELIRLRVEAKTWQETRLEVERLRERTKSEYAKIAELETKLREETVKFETAHEAEQKVRHEAHILREQLARAVEEARAAKSQRTEAGHEIEGLRAEIATLRTDLKYEEDASHTAEERLKGMVGRLTTATVEKDGWIKKLCCGLTP